MEKKIRDKIIWIQKVVKGLRKTNTEKRVLYMVRIG